MPNQMLDAFENDSQSCSEGDYPNRFELRQYQISAIKTLTRYVVCRILRLNGCKSNSLPEKNSGVYENASLVEMATGSGKTFVVGKFIDLIISMRNRYLKDDFKGLSILVLSNRIDGVNQFRDDLVYGRKGEDIKLPIISQKNLNNIRFLTFHSKADDNGYFEEGDKSSEPKLFSEQNVMSKDTIFFSTYQTAELKRLYEKIPYFDIVIIDEAHNVRPENGFESLLGKLAKKGRNGNLPYIIPITATPTDLTTDLFGKPVFIYGLVDYLMSEYSPNVEYRLVTKSTASDEDIESLISMIEKAEDMDDIIQKKELIKKMEEKFDEIMMSYPNLGELVDDLLARLFSDNNGEIDKTIIFANSIAEADSIAFHINKKIGEEIAVPYHSKNPDKKILSKLRDKNNKTKIVIAVDKLNESVDLPVVSNIVFWRNTDVPRIFLQQFGRGLRGNGVVRFYDYVLGIKNFSWILQIHEEVNRKLDGNDCNKNGLGGREKNMLLLSFGNGNNKPKEELDLSYKEIDIASIGLRIVKLRNKANLTLLTQDIITKYFKERGSLEYWKSLTPKKRAAIKINGYGVWAIARKMLVEGDPVSNKKTWHQLLSRIFDMEVKYEGKGELTQDIIVKYFRENGELKYWTFLTKRKRATIRINGHGLKAIAVKMGMKGDPVNCMGVWHQLLERIFNAKVERLTEETITKYFKENGNPKDWIPLTKKERETIKINGCGLRAIAAKMGIEGNPVVHTKVWHQLLSRIFDMEIKYEGKEGLTQETITKYFKENGNPKDWIPLTRKERLTIKINGCGLRAIAAKMGIEGNPVVHTKVWHQLLSKIFDAEIKCE